MKKGRIPAYIATGLVCIAAMLMSHSIAIPLIIYTSIIVMMDEE